MGWFLNHCLRRVKNMLALTIPNFLNPVQNDGVPGARCPLLPALLCLIFLTTSCDYRPLYGGQTPMVSAKMAQVRIAPIAERSGQKLRNLLIDRIYQNGVPEQPTWQLQITLQESKFNNDIDRTDTATRTQIILQAQADLIDTSNKKIVWSRSNRVITGYNILISPFGTLINEDNASDRAISDLADDVTTQLGLFFATSDAP